jgi:hypothetical protein
MSTSWITIEPTNKNMDSLGRDKLTDHLRFTSVCTRAKRRRLQGRTWLNVL